MMNVGGMPERQQGFIQNATLGIVIQRMRVLLMHCIVLERPALLHHDPEELYDTWCNATKTEGYADIIPFKSIIIKAKISELCEYTPQNFWSLLHTHSVHIYHQCHNTGASSYAE